MNYIWDKGYYVETALLAVCVQLKTNSSLRQTEEGLQTAVRGDGLCHTGQAAGWGKYKY